MYKAIIFNDSLKKIEYDEFEISAIKYKWMTLNEMKDDKVIMNKNKEVVSFIENTVTDLAVAEKSYSDYKQSGEKSRPIEELWKELDL